MAIENRCEVDSSGPSPNAGRTVATVAVGSELFVFCGLFLFFFIARCQIRVASRSFAGRRPTKTRLITASALGLGASAPQSLVNYCPRLFPAQLPLRIVLLELGTFRDIPILAARDASPLSPPPNAESQTARRMGHVGHTAN